MTVRHFYGRIYYLKVSQRNNIAGINTGYKLEVKRPEQAVGVISGLVRSDATSALIGGAILSVLREGMADGSTITASDGSYIVVALASSSDLQVTANATGFASQTLNISLTTGGDTATQDFNLLTDTDGDGVLDPDDNCPAVSNPGQEDFDNDNLGDVCDDDDDNDGWTDVDEGTCGTDSLDDLSIPTDTDNDGECDVIDTDDDNDGWTDSDEGACGTDSLDALSIPTDTDNDGECNVVDTDDDNDGWTDSDEGACGTDSLDALSIPTDTDNDGECNVVDTDDDNDGVPDITDQFPLDANESVDTDGDGIGDNSDNCPKVSNSDQLDTNGNGIGNACEPEDDGFIYLLPVIKKILDQTTQP